MQTGRDFEKVAAHFFENSGFRILEYNWHDGPREIDLIIQRNDLIVFVEVKSSSTGKFGHPVERVDKRKKDNLAQAAQRYLIDNNIHGCDLRFDVVTFINGQLEHFPNAFSVEE